MDKLEKEMNCKEAKKVAEKSTKAGEKTIIWQHFSETFSKYFSFVIIIIFGGQECVSHSFAYVAYFIFLRDVYIRTQRAAVASRRATNLANNLPD
jgi:hypothetical protein